MILLWMWFGLMSAAQAEVQAEPRPEIMAQVAAEPTHETTNEPAADSASALRLAIGGPQPVQIGYQMPLLSPFEAVRKTDFRAFVDAGWFQLGFANNKRISLWSAQVGTQWFPWAGRGWSFSTAVGFRRASVTADISSIQTDGEPLASVANMPLHSVFVALGAGYEWRLGRSHALGIELGIQLSVISWGGVNIEANPNASEAIDLTVEDSEVARRIGGLKLPQIALIRWIWYI